MGNKWGVTYGEAWGVRFAFQSRLDAESLGAPLSSEVGTLLVRLRQITV